MQNAGRRATCASLAGHALGFSKQPYQTATGQSAADKASATEIRALHFACRRTRPPLPVRGLAFKLGFMIKTPPSAESERDKAQQPAETAPVSQPESAAPTTRKLASRPPEFGGPKGPEPTRYGDWERNGRCSDF